MTIGKGRTDGVLTDADIKRIVSEGLGRAGLEGKSLLLILPDHTRTAPVGSVFKAIRAATKGVVKKLDVLIALGTHPPMTEEMINARVELTPEERAGAYADVAFYNHRWRDPETLAHIGAIPAEEIDRLSGGLFRMEVDVTVNKLIFDYDCVCLVGPVFPHEVVGFSGGNKYLFPGVSGKEILNFFHWLGAVITNPRIIGNKHTPVRAVLDRAAGLVAVRRLCLAMVVREGRLAGLYFGSPEEAWEEAANLSGRLHIHTCEHPFHTVLSAAPRMYDDLWTGGKCMYKLEPVVADGGELIIYAPHITETSVTHGRVIREIGYHTRDYFLKQWDRFKRHPWGVLAHSTHVRGIGTYENGVERCRVKVTLATGIPEKVCRSINLGYRDPASIRVEEFLGREDEGVLYVPKAGETLYKLRNPPAWQVP
ncbi:MAG: lactate racemase domain-containing protein [Planctomycetota bacterium]